MQYRHQHLCDISARVRIETSINTIEHITHVVFNAFQLVSLN